MPSKLADNDYAKISSLLSSDFDGDGQLGEEDIKETVRRMTRKVKGGRTREQEQPYEEVDAEEGVEVATGLTEEETNKIVSHVLLQQSSFIPRLQ